MPKPNNRSTLRTSCSKRASPLSTRSCTSSLTCPRPSSKRKRRVPRSLEPAKAGALVPSCHPSPSGTPALNSFSYTLPGRPHLRATMPPRWVSSTNCFKFLLPYLLPQAVFISCSNFQLKFTSWEENILKYRNIQAGPELSDRTLPVGKFDFLR